MPIDSKYVRWMSDRKSCWILYAVRPMLQLGNWCPLQLSEQTLHPFGSDKPFKIKKQKVRGEVSQGMICAEDELGVGTDHDGIMVFEGEYELGSPAINAIALDEDHVFEIDLTPNRIDGASHYGVARDLAAYYRAQPKLPELSLKESDMTTTNPIPVTIKDEEKCKRYVSIYIEGVTVTESPDWLKQTPDQHRAEGRSTTSWTSPILCSTNWDSLFMLSMRIN